jgi:hypothetical protein
LLASISAPYSAGSSVGAISAVKSIAAPIRIGLPLLALDPLDELDAELLPPDAPLLLLLLLDPQPAITPAATSAVSAAPHLILLIASVSPLVC